MRYSDRLAENIRTMLSFLDFVDEVVCGTKVALTDLLLDFASGGDCRDVLGELLGWMYASENRQQ